MDKCEHFDLLEKYVDVCNEALLRNANRFPFKQILGAAQKSEFDAPVEVVLSDTLPQEVYVFRLASDGISVQPHDECVDCACVRSWKTNTHYLEGVIKKSQAYINNPAMIDWEWMYETPN